MKRILLAAVLCFCISSLSFAQQTDGDAPATKEDIQKYLNIMHSREMVTKMMEAMLKPMHQMMHEQFLKDKDKLPPDFESQMNRDLDNFLRSFPYEEMIQAMVPVYQKHFTRNDINSLTAFYSSPTGQKLIQEMPAITAESMQTMIPLMQKQADAMKDRMQQHVAQMLKESNNTTGNKSQATPK